MSDESETNARIALNKEKLRIWSRQDEQSNTLIWKDFDIKLDQLMFNCMKNRNYEAYAFLAEFKESMSTKMVATLKNLVLNDIQYLENKKSKK